MVPLWPSLLPQRHLRDGYTADPHQPLARVEMEQGGQRKRRRTPTSQATVSLKWRMTTGQFALFAGFYRQDLVEGTGWFSVPLWTGDGMESVEARFTDRYAVRPRGPLAVTVEASLTLRGLPVMDEAVAADLLTLSDTGMTRWPDALPDAVLVDGLSLDPHLPVAMTDATSGPLEKRLVFPASPASARLQWRMTPAQFGAFKGFYRWLLRDGAAWFEAPVWTGSGFERVAAQFSDRYSFSPAGARDVLVTAEAILRELPMTAADAAWFLAAWDGSFPAVANGVNQFVHVLYPAAV